MVNAEVLLSTKQIINYDKVDIEYIYIINVQGGHKVTDKPLLQRKL